MAKANSLLWSSSIGFIQLKTSENRLYYSSKIFFLKSVLGLTMQHQLIFWVSSLSPNSTNVRHNNRMSQFFKINPNISSAPHFLYTFILLVLLFCRPLTNTVYMYLSITSLKHKYRVKYIYLIFLTTLHAFSFISKKLKI